MLEYPTWAAHPYLRSSSRSLLPEAIRRELAALNTQYLATVATAGDDATPCCWRGTPTPFGNEPSVLEGMATCPFTLFELRLDEIAARGAAPGARDGSAPAWTARPAPHAAVAQSALTLAWRLAESSPLSLRLALGLSAKAELVINEMRVTSLATWAGEPGLLRTRWVEHAAFWKGLLKGAERNDAGALARMHCLGITLLAGELGPRVQDAASVDGGAGKWRR